MLRELEGENAVNRAANEWSAFNGIKNETSFGDQSSERQIFLKLAS